MVPENTSRFPNYPLSDILYYSPEALNYIRQLTRGEQGYIMGGLSGPSDLALSKILGLG